MECGGHAAALLMRAAWYERQGPARDVLVVGEMDDPSPAPGEVRIRIAASGINPGDIKKRNDAFGYGMAYPRVIPHSDGAGVIDKVGDGVSEEHLGRRVWCFGAQSYRPFGTAAEFTTVPLHNAVPLPDGVPFKAGACLGIPGITAHRAVHVAGDLRGKRVLVHGARGAVGELAVLFAERAGATIVQENADHIVTVDFATCPFDALAPNGSIAAYAASDPHPTLPFWPLLFRNARLYLLGSDDFPLEAKLSAARELNAMLAEGWEGPRIARTFPLGEIALAHEAVESGHVRGRVVVSVPARPG
jgi:NADPH2:quinone reductase